MTDYQIEFLQNNFFKNEKYPGWKTISEKLIRYGICMVAGTDCIWHGGIGNFIDVTPAEDSSFYEFDLQYFLNSEWFKEVHSYGIVKISDDLAEVSRKVREIEQQYEELINL